MIKVLMIAPYEGLLELTKEIANEINDIEIHSRLGNLEEAVDMAKRAEEEGYDVIISRGGTASMIEEVASIPVINIQVSGYDVLRIITLFKGLAGNAAIVGYPNVTQGATMISSLLDINIKTITLEKGTNVKEELLQLRKENYEIIIGDVVTVQAAKELGLNGVLIISGREAILVALEEARRVHRLFLKLKNDVVSFQELLQYDKRAVAIIDKEYKIVYENEAFKQVPSNFIENNNSIKEIIDEVTGNRNETIQKIYYREQLWNVRAVFVNDNVGLFLDLELNHRKDISCFPSVQIETSIPYAVLHGKSQEIQTIIRQVEMYSKLEEPIWITGETGSGKGIVAHLIYSKWKKENEFLITFDCKLLTNEQWQKLIDENFFTRNRHALFYFKSIDQLDPLLQKELYVVMKGFKKDELPRFVSSSEETIDQKVRDGLFNADLFHSLYNFVIQISPLRQRREDIEQLVHVFISEAHVKYGKQVVGIREDALKRLMNYEWPGNRKQLKKVIEQLVVLSASYYIDIEEVEQLLTKVNNVEVKTRRVTNCNNIDLTKTLAEIEKQVITQVLEEEEMNQSKAAKRLGINRSTLWRKLK